VVNTIINLKTLVAEKPAVFETDGGLGCVLSGLGRRHDNKELGFLNDFLAKERPTAALPSCRRSGSARPFPTCR
jgi:hypothetical protein